MWCYQMWKWLAPDILQIRAGLDVRGQSRSDGRMIHGIVKGFGAHGHHPKLLRLLLREATGEPRSWWLRRQIWFRLVPLRVLCFVVGVNIVRFGGPTEQRGPPVVGGGFPAIWIGPSVSGDGACLDSDRADGDHSGSHFGNQIFNYFSVLGIWGTVRVPNAKTVVFIA